MTHKTQGCSAGLEAEVLMISTPLFLHAQDASDYSFRPAFNFFSVATAAYASSPPFFSLEVSLPCFSLEASPNETMENPVFDFSLCIGKQLLQIEKPSGDNQYYCLQRNK